MLPCFLFLKDIPTCVGKNVICLGYKQRTVRRSWWLSYTILVFILKVPHHIFSCTTFYSTFRRLLLFAQICSLINEKLFVHKQHMILFLLQIQAIFSSFFFSFSTTKDYFISFFIFIFPLKKIFSFSYFNKNILD